MNDLQIGDYVRVLSDTPDDDTGQSLKGWVGIVVRIQHDAVEVAWNTDTFLEAPDEYFERLVDLGYEYDKVTFLRKGLEKIDKPSK